MAALGKKPDGSVVDELNPKPILDKLWSTTLQQRCEPAMSEAQGGVGGDLHKRLRRAVGEKTVRFGYLMSVRCSYERSDVAAHLLLRVPKVWVRAWLRAQCVWVGVGYMCRHVERLGL